MLLHGHTDAQNNLIVEKIKPQEKKNVFLFIKGLKKDDYSQRLIKMINSIDSNRYNVFVCMKEDNVKKATGMLSQLKKEVAYFPILYDINYTRMDYILCKLLLVFGVNTKATRTRMDKVMKREIQKYFGTASFDYVIHQSELDRMIGLMCSLLGKTTVYNFKYFNFEMYKDQRGYRKQVKYFVKRFPYYTMVVATKECKTLKRKADNIFLNEEVTFPMDKVLKELDS